MEENLEYIFFGLHFTFINPTSGEEDEEVLIEDRCKLYRFIEGFSGKEWKERGLGQIKILKHKVSGKQSSCSIINK